MSKGYVSSSEPKKRMERLLVGRDLDNEQWGMQTLAGTPSSLRNPEH